MFDSAGGSHRIPRAALKLTEQHIWGGVGWGAVRVYRQRHMTPLVSVPTYGGQSAFLCPLHIAVLYF